MLVSMLESKSLLSACHSPLLLCSPCVCPQPPGIVAGRIFTSVCAGEPVLDLSLSYFLVSPPPARGSHLSMPDSQSLSSA